MTEKNLGQKSILILLIFFVTVFFMAMNTSKAALLSGTDGLQGSFSSTSCTTDLCYNTTKDLGLVNSDFSHIGLRFSIVDANGENVSGVESQDFLTPTLRKQLNNISGNILAFSYKTRKRDISQHGKNWYSNTTIGADIVPKTGAQIVSESNPSSENIMQSFDNIIVNKNAAPGSRIFNQIFGSSGNKIVENYNIGYNINGNVFADGSITDKDSIDLIIKSLLPLSCDDPKYSNAKADCLVDKNYYIQIEPITIINARIGSKYQRYKLYGTTSEIRAMMAQIAVSNSSTSWEFNIGQLFEHGQNEALTSLNEGMYATIQLGSLAYGGNAGTCSHVDWILPQNHNCGIGILSGLGEGRKNCEIENDTSLMGGKAYYGSTGIKLNDYFEKPAEEFINECVCNVSDKSYIVDKNTYFNFDPYRSLKNENSEYIKNWCEKGTKTNTKQCDPEVKKDECGKYIIVRDKKSCVFDDTIDTVVSSSASTNKHTYTTEANEYCNISCVEEIKFDLPGKVTNITAGTYFTFPNLASLTSPIKSTGTRTCRATIDKGNFEKVVSKKETNSSTLNDIANKILEYKGSKFEFVDKSDYSYLEKNDALYSVYNTLPDSVSGDPVSTNYDCGPKDYWGHYTQHYYKATYTFNGKTFESERKCNSSSFSSSELKVGSQSLSELKKVVFEGIDKTAQALEGELKKLQNCTNSYDTDKGTEYDFNPDISFSYVDPYNRFFTDKSYIKGEASSTSNQQNTANSSITYHKKDSSSIKETNKKYAVVDSNCNGGKCYIESTVTKEIKSYTSPVNFYSSSPSGTMTVETGSGFQDYLYTYYDNNTLIGNVYPVALNQKKGTYKYEFTVSNLGDYRILTQNSSVGRMDKKTSKSERTYTCNYSVIEDIYTHGGDGDDINFFYRNVSLNNFNPNGRTNLGKNWKTEKAKKTLDEITGQAEEAYKKEPQYSFKLTPDNMQKIREYNKEQEEKGLGYADFNMTEITETQLKNESSTAMPVTKGIWWKSNFLSDINKYAKDYDINAEFTQWSNGTSKLSGTGPAWK